jgi:cation diffusion facilitator CzcD-associated flavoprotein CzcO
MDVFVRTAVWFVQVANNYNDNHQYTAEEIATFRNDKKALVAHAKNIEDQINGIFEMFFSGSKEQLAAQDLFRNRMSEFIKDKRLLEGFTPKWALGCRRITPGDPYMKAIQEPNVDVHFTAVNEITKDGLIGADGKGRKVDTIICATGFDVSYRPRFPIIGQNGVDLADKWEVCPEGYMGLGIPDMPNFITFIGPAWPIENGSVMGPLDAVTAYVVKIIKKMQGENIRSLVPRQDITDLFNAHTQEFIKHSVWTEDCRSWYKNNDTGRVNAIWPGSSLHYIQAIREPRYEDYNITYHSKNP